MPVWRYADIGRGFQNGLAFELEHQAQHAVGRRVLRAHVEDHASGARFVPLMPFVVLFDFEITGDRRRPLIAFRNSSDISTASPVTGYVLAQRVSNPIVRHHDSA